MKLLSPLLSQRPSALLQLALPVEKVELPLSTILQLAEKRRSPHVEGQHVTFLYQADSSVQQVELAGELTGWHSHGLKLQRHGDLFYITLNMPADTRLEYKFLVDRNWALDPWNAQQVQNGIGGMNSAVGMSEWKPSALTEFNPQVAHGRVISEVFNGKAISGARHIHVYLPPNYEPATPQRYPVLYAHDGGDYIQRGKLHWVLDNLIASGKIEPLIAVCIDPRDRFKEYTMNPDYCHLLVQEIVPHIDRIYRTQPQAARRTLLGSSLGGLISTYMAFHFPHIFGQVYGQSSSYQFFAERMVTTLRDLPQAPLKMYLTAGRLEGLIGANRRMQQVLSHKGYQFEYAEFNQGHNWAHWKHTLPEGLSYLFKKP